MLQQNKLPFPVPANLPEGNLDLLVGLGATPERGPNKESSKASPSPRTKAEQTGNKLVEQSENMAIQISSVVELLQDSNKKSINIKHAEADVGLVLNLGTKEQVIYSNISVCLSFHSVPCPPLPYHLNFFGCCHA